MNTTATALRRTLAALPVLAWPRVSLRINTVMVLAALYIALLLNRAFWRQVFARLPDGGGWHDAGLLLALFVALNVLLLLVMLPFSATKVVRPFAGMLIIIASVCAYFMDAYGVVIDAPMIGNLFQTDPREAHELLSFSLIAHVVLSGILPAVLIWRVPLQVRRPLAECLSRGLLLGIALALLAGTALANYKSVSLWARENRDVRLYVNPTYPLYAMKRYLVGTRRDRHPVVAPIADDAVRAASVSGKPRVVILLVGETARAANHSLLGYARVTNPELAAEPGIVAYSDTWSCGTATAYSLPCMFSRLGRAHFSRDKAASEENLLDVLRKTGVDVLWRDNNSDCKGVCLRVTSVDLRKQQLAGICDEEGCRDEVLLDGLDTLLQQTNRDRLIVLHLLGSHGPSYFKRYPPAFRRFTPDCVQDDVQNCSREAIVNAYDNSILYTDHVLAEVIALLKRHQAQIEPSMFYVSDHGESLGENGVYLHGLPYALAPDEQKHVPMVIWAPSRDRACIAARRDTPTSQDDLFPTMLGLYGISTREYRAERDLLRGC